MGRHHCKICSRSFINGKALGGHMRAHLAPLPIPPKQPIQLSESIDSISSFSAKKDGEGKDTVYGLRENSKRSFKLVDPELLDAGSVIDQDITSGTELTRWRSKRTRRMCAVAKVEAEDDDPRQRKVGSTEPTAELETVSSVSDTYSLEDEEVAMCLLMLSRDVWPIQSRRIFQCETCKKVFKSSQALGGHSTSHKRRNNSSESRMIVKNNVDEAKVHECPICFKVFGSGQALGGHKRSHFLGSSSSPITADASPTAQQITENGESVVVKCEEINFGGGSKLIDLNLPPPMEDDDFAVHIY